MGRPSQQLVNRFELTLDPHWIDWFDGECKSLEPAGSMQSKLDAASLCEKAPRQIWSGFMLPDSLPLVGNDYGDWICGRVAADGRMGELIYWYHGGGDWIPVGNCLAEALLHDAVDQFRSQRSQMLRGAPEASEGDPSQVLRRLGQAEFQGWLVKQLSVKTRVRGSRAEGILQQILGYLDQRQSQAALQLMAEYGVAEDAVACDLIELALQYPLELLAKKEIADCLDMPWYPDFSRLLFDVEAAPPDLRSSILACA